jgi:hypothetical protein
MASMQPRDSSGRFIRFRLFGKNEVSKKMNRILSRLPSQIAKALYEEAQIEMTESKKRVPVDTGDLRASGRVTLPVYKGRTVSVQLLYGNSAVSYAIEVHENEEMFHDVGQAFYLSSVLEESAPHMMSRIRARIDLTSL